MVIKNLNKSFAFALITIFLALFNNRIYCMQQNEMKKCKTDADKRREKGFLEIIKREQSEVKRKPNFHHDHFNHGQNGPEQISDSELNSIESSTPDEKEKCFAKNTKRSPEKSNKSPKKEKKLKRVQLVNIKKFLSEVNNNKIKNDEIEELIAIEKLAIKKLNETTKKPTKNPWPTTKKKEKIKLTIAEKYIDLEDQYDKIENNQPIDDEKEEILPENNLSSHLFVKKDKNNLTQKQSKEECKEVEKEKTENKFIEKEKEKNTNTKKSELNLELIYAEIEKMTRKKNFPTESSLKEMQKDTIQEEQYYTHESLTLEQKEKFLSLNVTESEIKSIIISSTPKNKTFDKLLKDLINKPLLEQAFENAKMRKSIIMLDNINTRNDLHELRKDHLAMILLAIRRK